MDGQAFLVRLLVTLAVLHTHPIDCILTANISKTLDIGECPETCVCDPEKGLTRMNCSIGRMSGKEINLEIGKILMHLIPNITALSISREPMMDSVPMIICRMQMLEVLDLSRNSITGLPIGCFTKLERLRKLNFECNRISTLKRGTIEGLQKLEELILNSNKLVSIDPEIFSNRSDLISLNNLDFAMNQIPSVDGWIFLRAQVHPGCTVNLGKNSISNFTNNVGWTFRCGMTPLNFHLKLNSNPLQRIRSIFKPYITHDIDIMCMFGNDPYTKFDLELHSSTVICDCQEFRFVRISKYFTHAHELEQITCSEPSELEGKKMMYIHVDAFMCDIVDQCPSGCHCTKQPSTMTIHVECANANLQEMPLNLPQITQNSSYKYNLILAGNAIKQLEYRDYMKTTASLDVNHAEVTNIDEEVWRSFEYMSEVNLNGNKLKQIPKAISSLKFSRTVLDIRDNPLSCDCDSRWLKSWLTSVSGNLQNPNGILCNEPPWLNGKSILALEEEEFCRGPPYTINDILEITIPSIGGVILLNFLLVYLTKKYRIQIYKYVKLHPFDRDECIGEDVDYDAFLSCSSKDIELGILQLLEKEGCKVCYHENDFTPGGTISENIINAIAKSKRTICVLTRNFIESGWCMEEFRQSHYRDLEKKKTRLVVVLVDMSVIGMEGISPELREYLSRYNYIEYESKFWKDRLMYAMPVNRMNKDENCILAD